MYKTLAIFTLGLFLALPSPVDADDHQYAKVQKLLDTQTTNLDQSITYPETTSARVISAIISLKPGEETGRHKHQAPLFAHVLEGQVSITYEGHGTKIYKAGDTFMEGFNVWHNGKNVSDGPLRILAVFMGADGVKNTVTIRK